MEKAISHAASGTKIVGEERGTAHYQALNHIMFPIVLLLYPFCFAFDDTNVGS